VRTNPLVHQLRNRPSPATGRRRGEKPWYDVPARAIAVPLTEVTELGASHFSLGRTGAAVGGLVAAAGVVLLILVEEGAEPIY